MDKISKMILVSLSVAVLGGVGVALALHQKAPEAICWKNLRGTEIPDDFMETIVLEENAHREIVWKKNSITANVGGTETFLTGGTPIWAVYFSDLNGDGQREMIAEISTGGTSDHGVIVVYDFKRSTTNTLDEPMMNDYSAEFRDGAVYAVKKPYGSESAGAEKGKLRLTDKGLEMK